MTIHASPRVRARSAALLVALAATAVACGGGAAAPDESSTDEAGGCASYEPPVSFDAASPAVDFTADVVPLLQRSCAFVSCHGAPGGPAGGMYLGSDAATTYANLVNAPATIAAPMVRVKPGDPASSFLQLKIDGDACTVAACTGVCAESMPQGQGLMAPGDRLTIRAWIAQGAASE